MTRLKLLVQLGALTISRLFLNTGIRMVYPFLPTLARGLGVSLGAVAGLIAIRGLVSLLSPFFGTLSERYGRRPVLMMAMLLFSFGCALVYIWPAFWPLGLTLSIIALGKVIFDPTMQAYLGDLVPYQQRGRAIALTELSWAGAFFLGVPAIAFVIEHQDWQSAFAGLGLLGLVGVVLIWRILPSPIADGRASRATSLQSTWALIRQQPVIWAASVYMLLVMVANELILVVYGDWMEVSFALSLASLGLATSVIGGAEIAGELMTGVAVDRFGKRPIVTTTGILTSLLYLATPYSSVSLPAALATLFTLFLFFEMTVVGGIPLMTELVPTARGIVMSIILAAGGLGRVLGALLGPIIWSSGNLSTIGISSATIMLVAVTILVLSIHEGRTTSQGLEVAE